MSDTQGNTQSKQAVSLTGKPFGEMSGSEKISFIGKCLIMLITGGFVFPNIFVD